MSKTTENLMKYFHRMKYKGDFNLFVHELRTLALKTLPKAKILLSAGCSGLWYFDWIDKNLGKPEEHIGVEYYSPQPDNLPEHVKWVQDNVYAMDSIVSNSVDMIFSGQNVEHLWSKELAGFLSESHRILQEEGILVIDSPNFDICQQYGWSHPEHITELNLFQITKFLCLAGFEIETCFGLWGCKNKQTLLPLEPENDDAKSFLKIIDSNYKSMKDRLFYGLIHPEDAFIWWIVARKTRKTQVTSQKLLKLITYEYNNNWRQRIQRLNVPDCLANNDSSKIVTVPKDYSGVVVYGPYIPLRKGKYHLGYYFKISKEGVRDKTNEEICILDCVAGTNGDEITSKKIFSKDFFGHSITLILLEIDLKEITFGVQVRIISHGKREFQIYKNLVLLNDKFEECQEADS